MPNCASKSQRLLIFILLIGLNSVASTKELAITFDDLPGLIDASAAEETEINQKILKGLLKFKVPAIGFVNESKLYSLGETEKKIGLLKQWVDDGFDLGNHTYSHPFLSDLSKEQLQSELTKGSQVSQRLMKEAGKQYKYFRHPYLDTGATPEIRNQIDSALKTEGYLIAPVTIDSDDWKFNKQLIDHPQDKAKIIQHYLEHTQAKFAFYEKASEQLFGREIKQIWLLHVNRINADTIDSLLTIAQKFGYHFISLDQALTDKAYQSPDNYYSRYGMTWLYHWDYTRGKAINWNEDPIADNDPLIIREALSFYDTGRKQAIPVQSYVSDQSKAKAEAGVIKLPIVLINQTNSVNDQANRLAAEGNFVITIPAYSKLSELDLKRSLQKTHPYLDFTKLTRK